MDIKNTCKLCYRSFANGRALGGHMRSHVTAATTTPKPIISIKDSSSPSSSSSSKAINDGVDAALDVNAPLTTYRLRENPKKSTRLIVEERDGEGDLRRRSCKRVKSITQLPPESEPVSSVSTPTAEEDVAFSLVLLSRDIWHKSASGHEQADRVLVPLTDDDAEEEEEEEEFEEEIKIQQRSINPKRSRYKCGTCKKVFRSYQALGGHRANHKKNNGCAPAPVKIHGVFESKANNAGTNNVERVVEHECPVCYRVFGSGQALGGHKRSHMLANPPANASTFNKTTMVNRNGESWIDLNLPAPMEDDAELSAVCDA